MRYSVSIFILCVVLLGGCSSEITDQPNAREAVNTIDLQILKDGQVNFDGEVMSIAGFGKELKRMDFAEKALVEFSVHKEASMGDITDVQALIRDKGVTRINYRNIN